VAETEASVRHSRGLIVPSEGMREVMLDCYPSVLPKTFMCCPGAPGNLWTLPIPILFAASMNSLKTPHPADTQPDLPEKGQDLLLDALLNGNSGPTTHSVPWCLHLRRRGIHAGQKFLQKLHSKRPASSAGPESCFPATVTESATGLLRLTDLYVFLPARKLRPDFMEALSAGLPAVCLDHHGARSVMKDEFVAIVVQPTPGRHPRLLADEPGRVRMGQAARPSQQTNASPAARKASRITTS